MLVCLRVICPTRLKLATCGGNQVTQPATIPGVSRSLVHIPTRKIFPTTIMPAYSNLFSSGLLAPSVNTGSLSRPHTPVPPSSPMVLPTTPGDPIDRDMTWDPSYTNDVVISPGPTISKDFYTNTTEHRPRLRKRRSSLSVNTSPMAGIKSPGRSAGNALQRTGLLSPSRSSIGSMNDFHQHGRSVATEGTSLTGRMRSGSLGGALR